MYVTFVLGEERVDVLSLLEKALPQKKIQEILTKTGPEAIYIAGKNENSFTLGIDALLKLLRSEVATSSMHQEVGALISVTETPMLQLPGNSTSYISRSSLKDDLFAVDLNAGCTGFVDAIRLAFGLKAPTIIVTSETYSTRIVGIQRNLTPVFSDGAAACYFEPVRWKMLAEVSSVEKGTASDLSCKGETGLHMNGSVVVQFVMERVVQDLKSLISKFDPTHIYLHQGSLFVVEHLLKTLKISSDVYCPSNIKVIGNTVSSSIPILISETGKQNQPAKGDRVLMSGFGVGLAHSAVVLEAK